MALSQLIPCLVSLILISSAGFSFGSRHTHEEKEEIIRYNKVPQSEWAIPGSHHNLSTKETGTFRPHPIHPFVDLSGRQHRVGKLEGKKVVYVRCGVRMVNAVAAAQQMLDLFDVTGVVHFGIAGNTNDSMSIGDVSIPEKVAHTGIWNWLRTCLLNGFPVIVIRGLSDLAGGQPGQNSIDIFGPFAALNAAKTVVQFVKKIP